MQFYSCVNMYVCSCVLHSRHSGAVDLSHDGLPYSKLLYPTKRNPQDSVTLSTGVTWAQRGLFTRHSQPCSHPSLLVVARATFPPHALRTATTKGAKLPWPPVTTKVCPASIDTPKPASDKGHRQLTAWVRHTGTRQR